MGILLELTYGCNLDCVYCYQKERRKIKGLQFDFEKVEHSLDQIIKEQGGCGFVALHGGEPLTVPLDMLEKVMDMLARKGCKITIQTNGTILSDKHIDLFKRYNVQVGVSVDGYWPLNAFRTSKKMTEKILKNIYRLKDSGIWTSVIVVVSKANVGREHRDRMKKFISDLWEKRITGRLNPVVHFDDYIVPTVEEFKDFYLDLAEWMLKNGIQGWSPYQDIINQFTGYSKPYCFFSPCFPYASPAAKTILPNGFVSTCHKDTIGTVFENVRQNIPIREWILYNTECKGCKWFWYCYGGCPANAVGKDWRRKDRLCPVWKALFEFYEKVFTALGIKIKEPDKSLFKVFEGMV